MDVWIKKKKEEADRSADIEDGVKSQWEKIFKLDGPYELHEVKF